MFKNYLLVAWRNVWKNRLNLLINAGGMTLALVCSIFMLLVVYQHFSFDRSFTHRQQLYKLYSAKNGKGGAEQDVTVPYPLRTALANEVAGVAKVSGIYNYGKLVKYKEKTLDMSVTLVDPDFIGMFDVQVVKGDASPLYNPNNVVLTESTARKLFASEDPIGKYIAIKSGKEWQQLAVTAVVKDMPVNASVQFMLLGRIGMQPNYNQDKDSWSWQHTKVYVQLADNVTQQAVEARLKGIVKKYLSFDAKYENELGFTPYKDGSFLNYHLLPLTQEHFNTALGSNTPVNKSLLYVLILISGVILLIACFNFVNLTVSASYTRAKEMGVRRCMGAGKRQIWLQIWGESTLLIALSLVLALLMVALLIPTFNQLFDNRLKAALLLQPGVWLLLVGLLMTVSLLASGYPASILSAQKTVEVFKGSIAIKRPGLVRNALLIAQFTIAMVLMVCTVVIVQQFNHLRTVPLGYNTNAVISIPLKNEENGKALVQQLRTRLANYADVVSVTGSDANVGEGRDKTDNTSVVCMRSGANTVCGQVIYGDDDFLKTLGIQPVSGKDFTVRSNKPVDGNNKKHIEAIFSQGYAALFGLKEISSGSVTTMAGGPDDGAVVEIVAVIPDVLFQSLKSKQYPLVIYNSANSNSMNYAFVKVNTTNATATMKKIAQVYAAVEPGVEFKGSYVDENIARLYRAEQVLANLLTLVAGVAIVLSCMGLFGMASMVIRQRTKEIGVRKVLGATVGSIIVLVNKAFIRPVMVAFLLAAPIAWWATHVWLQDYVYRVTIHWWVFALAGTLILLIALCTVSFQSVKAAIAKPVDSLKNE